VLFTDDIHAEFDALVADEHGRPSDEFADFMLALAAERTIKGVFGITPAAATGLAHGFSILAVWCTGNMLAARFPVRQCEKTTLLGKKSLTEPGLL
jgi:hypothetical protein